MLVNATVCIKTSKDEYKKLSFTIDIPDDIVEEYARKELNLMTEDEATEYVADNPPEYDEP